MEIPLQMEFIEVIYSRTYFLFGEVGLVTGLTLPLCGKVLRTAQKSTLIYF
jgi:hypothetical protein